LVNTVNPVCKRTASSHTNIKSFNLDLLLFIFTVLINLNPAKQIWLFTHDS
jgi:hypothetical protein